MTTLCHSVFSLRSPVALSFQLSEVAMRRLTTGSPELSRRVSGSLPRLPTRMTLLTLPAMGASPVSPRCSGPLRRREQGEVSFSTRLSPEIRDIKDVLHLF